MRRLYATGHRKTAIKNTAQLGFVNHNWNIWRWESPLGDVELGHLPTPVWGQHFASKPSGTSVPWMRSEDVRRAETWEFWWSSWWSWERWASSPSVTISHINTHQSTAQSTIKYIFSVKTYQNLMPTLYEDWSNSSWGLCTCWTFLETRSVILVFAVGQLKEMLW